MHPLTFFDKAEPREESDRLDTPDGSDLQEYKLVSLIAI